jgi:aminoglycoside phosphotransferase family enzyme
MSESQYTQQPLLEALERGDVPGATGVPRHIQTVQSNVYLFEQIAYKVYKNDSSFFNKKFTDLSTVEGRKAFTKADFDWNNTLSPSIYRTLLPVRVEADTLVFDCSEEEVTELVVVMRRMHEKDVLLGKLFRGEVTPSACHSLGTQLGATLERAVTALPEADFVAFMTKRIDFVRWFIKDVNDIVPTTESEAYFDEIQARVDANGALATRLGMELVTGGDIHGGNCIIEGEELHLIDAYAPKEEWRVEQRDISMFRVGADVWALSESEDCYKAYWKGYEEGSGRAVCKEAEQFLLPYGAMIMVSYLYMLGRNNPEMHEMAKRYHSLVRTLLNT